MHCSAYILIKPSLAKTLVQKNNLKNKKTKKIVEKIDFFVETFENLDDVDNDDDNDDDDGKEDIDDILQNDDKIQVKRFVDGQTMKVQEKKLDYVYFFISRDITA